MSIEITPEMDATFWTAYRNAPFADESGYRTRAGLAAVLAMPEVREAIAEDLDYDEIPPLTGAPTPPKGGGPVVWRLRREDGTVLYQLVVAPTAPDPVWVIRPGGVLALTGGPHGVEFVDPPWLIERRVWGDTEWKVWEHRVTEIPR